MASRQKGTKKVKTEPFSSNKIQERASHGQFYNAKSGGLLNATGVEAKLKKDPNFLYNLGFMVAGTREDIANVLRRYGATEDQINSQLNSANTWSSNNVDMNLLKMYQERYRSYKKTVPEEEVNLADLDRWRVAERSRKKEEKEAGPRRSPRGSLREKYDSRDQSKVLSVSKLNSDGTGARTKPNATQKEAQSPTYLPGLVSDNMETYRMALDMLGLDPNMRQNALDEFSANLAATQNKGATSSTAAPTARQLPAQPTRTMVAPLPVPTAAATRISPMRGPVMPGATVAPAAGVRVSSSPTRVAAPGFPMVAQRSPRAAVPATGAMTF